MLHNDVADAKYGNKVIAGTLRVSLCASFLTGGSDVLPGGLVEVM